MSRLISVLVLVLCWSGFALGDESPPVDPKPSGAERETVTQEVTEDDSSDWVLDEFRKVLLGGTTVRGSLNAGYSYNLADPEQHRGGNALRLSDPDHNSFGLTHGVLGLERRVDPDSDVDVGYAFDLTVGRVVEEAYDDGLLQSRGIAIGQAYVDLKTPLFGGTKFRVGKEYGWFGLDSIDLSRNFHQSLSYAALSAPRTLMGVSAEIELLDGVTYAQYLVNGSDLAVDENDAKSLAGRLRLESDRASLTLSYLLGADRFDSEGELSWIAEAVGTYKFSEVFSIGGMVRVGQEEFNGTTREFGLLEAQARASLFEGRFVIGARASVLHDEDGMITGRDQSLLEVTATAEFRPLDQIGVGLEYRHDQSSEDDAFGGSRGPATRSDQDTLSFFFRVRF